MRLILVVSNAALWFAVNVPGRLPIIVVADRVVGALTLGMLLLLVSRFARNLYVLARMEPQRFER